MVKQVAMECRQGLLPGVRRPLAPWRIPGTALLTLVLAGGAQAEDPADAFQLFIAQALQADDNLFRLPDGEQPFGDQPRGDLLWITSLAGQFDRVYGRQHLSAKASLRHIRYTEYGYLDYTGADGRAAWDWTLGKRWNGVLSYAQTQAQQNFGDTGNTDRSIATTRRLVAEARFMAGADWALVGGLERLSSSYDEDDVAQGSDYTENGARLGLLFQPASGNRLELYYRHGRGDYPHRDAKTSPVTGYDQDLVQGAGSWRVTGHSTLSGNLGYTWRAYPDQPSKDFEGVTGRLTWDWRPTGKLAGSLGLRREIGAQEDLVANYVVTEALTLQWLWQATGKVGVRARGEWRSRDYGGDPFGLGSAQAAREERTRVLGLGLGYTPLRGLDLGADVSQDHRDANGTTAGYDAMVLLVSAQYAF